MKKVMLLWLLMVALTTSAQDSLTLSLQSTASKDLRDVMSILNIEQMELLITAPTLKNKRVDLYYEEYDTGTIVTKSATTARAPDFLCKAGLDSIRIKVLDLAQPDSTRIDFHFDRFYITDWFRTKKTNESYSMRYLYASGENHKKLPLSDKQIPIFCYSLPYDSPDEPNKHYYCALTNDGVPPALWWKKYHVRHYVVFYIKIS